MDSSADVLAATAACVLLLSGATCPDHVAGRTPMPDVDAVATAVIDPGALPQVDPGAPYRPAEAASGPPAETPDTPPATAVDRVAVAASADTAPAAAPLASALASFAQEAEKPPTPPHTGVHALLSGLVEDVRHLPAAPNIYIATIGGALAVGVHPFDDEVNQQLQGSENFWRPGKWVGQTPVQMAAAVLVYAVGRGRQQPKVSHLGMDLLRAQILTEGLTAGLKYATHRERPDGSNAQSFPSGHASITFATATVLERHLGWRYTALGYSIASYVAMSRLHDNRHWLSDVVFGAAVGAIGGRTVTQHGRATWTMSPVPTRGGVALVAWRTGAN